MPSSRLTSCRARLLSVAVAGLGLAAVGLPAVADDDGEGYRLRVSRRVDVGPGQERAVSLTVLPKTGFSISKDGPIAVRLAPSEGLEVRRDRYERVNAADPGAEAPRFEMWVRAGSVGRHRLGVGIRFWLCRKRTCRPIERELEVAVVAAEPAPDAGPDDTRDAGPH